MNSLNDFDISKFKLGVLCPYGHEYGDTKQSLRYISIRRCVICKKNDDAEFRKKQDKQKVAEYNKQYRETNKDKLAKQNKEYREKIRDVLLEKNKVRYEANKEQILKRQKEYVNKNKDRIKKRQSEYYHSLTPEQRAERNAYSRERYAKNIDAERNRSTQYRKNNPAKRAETNRNYRHSHRDAQNISNIKRRQRLAQQNDGSITPEFLSRIFKDAESCLYCGKGLVESQSLGRWEDVKTLDHINPLAFGGGHTQNNVLVCCRQCNIKKGTKPFIEWLDCLEEPYKSGSLAMYRMIRNPKHYQITKK